MGSNTTLDLHPGADDARALASLVELDARADVANLLRALTVRTPFGVFLCDTAGGCRFVNSRWSELSGLSFEEALGDGWAVAIHPEDRGRVAAEWETAADAHRDSVIRYRFLQPDGSVVWIEGHASAFHGEDGTLLGWVGACLDVTRYRLAEQELVRERELFRVAFEAAPIGVALVDLSGRCLSVNDALCRLLGYSRDELCQLGIRELTHPDDLEVDLDLAAQLVRGEIRSYQLEKRYLPKDGSIAWALLSVALVRDERGDPLHFIAHVEDIAERKKAEQKLRYFAEHDSLTGLLNRRSFEEQLEWRLTTSSDSTPLSVLLIDVDGFKGVNDTFGHKAGDRALAAVAQVVRARVHETDRVARLGGDEFAVIADAHDAPGLADRLLEAIKGACIPGGRGGAPLTVSIGIADTSLDTDLEHLLTLADDALYRAKEAGRGRAVHARDVDPKAAA